MSISTFVSLRYLTSSRKSLFLSWISLLSISGIAIGVAVLIVVLSVINGFQIELRDRFLSANAHILAYKFPHGMNNYKDWAASIEKDFGKEITGISPFVHYETMVKKGSLMSGVLIRGIDPEAREHVQEIKELIRPKESLKTLEQEVETFATSGTLPEVQSIILGSGVLTVLDAKVGETVNLISPSALDGSEMFKPFKIIGMYDSGLKHYDNKLMIMSLPAAQNFFGMSTYVTGLEIGLKNPNNSIDVANRMGMKYALTVKEWQSFNKGLFDAIQMERAVIGLIVLLVSIVAGFNILTTLIVSVTQKQRDISILKALGARNSQILAIFLNQGIYIGIVGCSVGVVLAFVIGKILERYKIIELPEPYFLNHLPVTYDWQVYLTISVLGILICVFAGLYPSLVASKVPPAEGIKGTRNVG